MIPQDYQEKNCASVRFGELNVEFGRKVKGTAHPLMI